MQGEQGEQGKPKQTLIDWQRGDQLRILRDCELPRDARGDDGKRVSGVVLKSVLIAIDQFARGRPGGCTAAVETLAASAGISRRSCMRALAILTALGFICGEPGTRRGAGGQVSPMVRRTVVWSQLALRCRETFFERETRLTPPRSTGCDTPPDPRKHGAPGADHGAPGADHGAPGADHGAPGADHGAPGGTLNVLKRQGSEQEAPTDVLVDDGARYFFEDEIAAIRAKANTLHGAARSKTPDDRELVLKVATLWHDGQLADDMLQQALESFVRKREQGAPVRNGPAWLWDVLRNQCASHGLRFEQLLACTDFPRELLVPPASRTSFVDGALLYTAAKPKPEASP